MMLQIAPTSWFSWNFTVSDASRHVADIAVSSWREKGTLTVDGATFYVYREAPMSGAFVLEDSRGEIARASKSSMFLRQFVIHHAGREFTLRPESMFRRAFVLLDGASTPIGSISPRGAFTRKATADLPAGLPLPVRAFMVWLTVISWRRDQSS